MLTEQLTHLVTSVSPVGEATNDTLTILQRTQVVQTTQATTDTAGAAVHHISVSLVRNVCWCSRDKIVNVCVAPLCDNPVADVRE